MSRSLKKKLFVDPDLLKKIEKINKAGKKGSLILTWKRDCIVSPDMIDHNIGVHNGKKHIKVHIIQEMIGHRLGEFAPTRRFGPHGKAGKH